MSDYKRPLAFIALGLLLAALLFPFLIAALGHDDLAVGFSIVAGLLALTLGAFSRSDRLGLSVIVGLFILFAFAGVLRSIHANHRRVENKAMATATADDQAQFVAGDNPISPPGANDFKPRYEATGRWITNGDYSNPVLMTRQGRHVVYLYNNGGYTHVFAGDYVDDFTVKGIATRCKLADHTITRTAITLNLLSPDHIKVEWVALDSNSDLAKGETGGANCTRAPAESEDAAENQSPGAPLGPPPVQPITPTASPAAYRPGNNGYLNFKFGMSLGQVFAALNDPSPSGSEIHSQDEERSNSADDSSPPFRNEWGVFPKLSKAVYSAPGAKDARPDDYKSLPIAGEYPNDVVRYYSVPMKSVPALRNLGGYSDSSALFFMFKNDKLFRISLRFLNDPSCQNHTPIYDAFVANNGSSLRFLYGNRKLFRVDGSNDYLIGALSLDGVFMTFIQNNSPMSLSENYNW